ncbi:MAG TPA: SIMPL domain-containing protein, partial [Candidatus Angelobacter sp.]|nr:SIMPL domain-containing protein [Candidatus Angelobacter sp.]
MKYGLIVVLALVSTIAWPQNAPMTTAQSNTIFAGADGKFEATPDTAVLRLDISSQQETSRAAYDKVAAAAEQVRGILRKNGIDPKAAQIGFYAVQPVYDWKNPKHKVIAYHVTTSVTLKLKDFSKVGVLTEQLADIEETQNQSLSYTLEGIDEA